MQSDDTRLGRRELLVRAAKAGLALSVFGPGGVVRGEARRARASDPRLVPRREEGVVVNDVHSQLNETRVKQVLRPESVEDVQRAVRRARARNQSISIAGGRHAMGGQQFGEDALLIDSRSLDGVLRFDSERGLIEVEAGIQWPKLIDHLVRVQEGEDRRWGIRQKQTGADRLCIGGALSANIHGRGLQFKPFVEDVESFVLVDAEGQVQRCSRRENAELFRLAVGGYGLFGIVTSVTLRLAPRVKMRRVVELLDVEELMPAFEGRIAEGFTYGDWQYAIDPDSNDFLRRGLFSCYRPIGNEVPMPAGQAELSAEAWKHLLYLAHADKSRAFQNYADHYLSTSGQMYWSDMAQLGEYIDDYHEVVSRQLHAHGKATEMITEIYVPREELVGFLRDVRRDLRRSGGNLIYGTIRLIERDDESVLAWARQPWACIIFNLCVHHNEAGLARGGAQFRGLIDRAIERGGSYYLTYHRWAQRRQVEVCHPGLVPFLRKKRAHDPQERFQSEWYRHYRSMFADQV